MNIKLGQLDICVYDRKSNMEQGRGSLDAVEAAKTITSTSNETKQQILLMKMMKQMQGSQQFHHPPLQKEGNHIFWGGIS